MKSIIHIRETGAPLLTNTVYYKCTNCSCEFIEQTDNVKSSTMDLRIEFETDEAVPGKTAVYCLFLYNQINYSYTIKL